MARARKSATDSLMQSEEFVEIALSSIEREIDATRDRLRRLTEVAAQLRQGRPASSLSVAPAAAGHDADSGSAAGHRRRRHNMSAEARKKLSERMRRRWDEYRKTKSKGARSSSAKAAK